MAKIKPYLIIDIYSAWWTEIVHMWWDHPFEPGAYHTSFPYQLEDLPPGMYPWQAYDNEEQAFLKARQWASMPLMVTDICAACRLYDYGPTQSRWNIYRGWNHVRHYPPAEPPFARVLPVFVQSCYDPPPPGFGP